MLISDKQIATTEAVTLNEFLQNYQSDSYERVELIDETNLRGFVVATGGTSSSFGFLDSFLQGDSEMYTVQTTEKPLQTTITDLGIDPASDETIFVASFTQ
ncbi:MAG: hypothetical protein H6766_02800 [Candidatus Peribacteria bacterium]|nr:MAG: hypothetical protein H6766_02800 [Candidatus Peribacteria bacterium]